MTVDANERCASGTHTDDGTGSCPCGLVTFTMVLHEAPDPNEHMALLCGWEHDPHDEDPMFWGHYPDGYDDDRCARGSYGPPDYTTWERFPDLQEYVRSLPEQEKGRVVAEANIAADKAGEHFFAVMLVITPEILRDAILEVVGEAVEA